jgi:hypothetical protein
VREALVQQKQLSEVDLAAHSPLFADLPADYLIPENIVSRKGRPPSPPAPSSHPQKP